MAGKEEYDRYAEELSRRFEDFIQWAQDNWPAKATPLLPSDFNESRKELQEILGQRLQQGQEQDESTKSPPNDGSIQYVNINPAPWP
ncbi:hypothetical protein Q8A64_06110 [Oxalobacteraceae bacterium R-40]|uniref:Uncharacterized protein n=1 Tax=Keguizhuia sedimenti TaxID=3064264 RepID=A0ABU1BLV3_9BURK|nr:hypothetical protein [Oxalobacteraceae bacterium R-40]